MICKNCNVSIPDRAAFCPLCGTETGGNTDAKIGSKKCLQCGAENPLGAKFCRVDGWRFPAADVETKPAVVQTSGSEIPCPTCGTLNPSTSRFCRKDGSLLKTDHGVPGNIAEEKVDAGIVNEPKQGIQEIKGIGYRIRRRWKYFAPLLILLLAVVYGIISGVVNHKESQQDKSPEATNGQYKTDIDIPQLEGRINRELRTEGLDGVTAEVDDTAVVTLKGVVKDPRNKKKAIKIAKSFKEVRQVKDIIFVIEQ